MSDRRNPTQHAKAPNILEDSDNPFDISFAPAGTINALPSAPLGFVAPSVLHSEKLCNTRHYERSPSPQDPPEQDFSAWFEPTTINPPIVFHSASTSLTSPKAPALVGFAKASNKGFIVPSITAFTNAREKMQNIWKEVDSENAAATEHPVHAPAPTRDGIENVPLLSSAARSKSSRRLALQDVENSPGTPSPAPFSRPTPQPNGLMSPTATDLFIKKHSKPFKSPLLAKNINTSSNSVSSPLNPASRRADIKFPTFSTVGSKNHHVGPSMQVSGPFSTPTRPCETVQRGSLRSKLRIPFTTPFKGGVNSSDMASRRPEDMIRSLQSTPAPQQHRHNQVAGNYSGVGRLPPKRTGVADLSKRHVILLIAY